MDKYTFKRTETTYDWSAVPVKGYTPHLNGEALPYLIEKCAAFNDWTAYEAWGEGYQVCGGLTLADAKQQFIKYYNSNK